jgi:hypothetical integral membrane protein (TIGR02206 family)
MRQYFAMDYHGAPFRFFSVHHLAALSTVLCICLLLTFFRNRFTESRRRAFRYSVATFLIVNEMSFHLWNILYGTWNIQSMLPLHLCSIMVFTSAAMMASKSYSLYEFVYFLGIGGAIQALLTPNIGIFGFPHFRFFQSYIAHGFIVISAIYMTVVEGFRPYPKSLLKVVFWVTVYFIMVTILNMLIGSNYMYTSHKLETPTLLDYLGPWPVYILSMEVLGLAVCSLLYVPFLVKDKILIKGVRNA